MAEKLYRSYFTYEGQKYERTSKKSQREADRKADAYKRDLEQGNVGISGKMRVKSWADEWFNTYKVPSIKSEKHRQNIKRHIDLVCEHIGNMRIKDVTDIHLQKVLNTRQGMSQSEAKHLYGVIRGMFAKARKTRKNGFPIILFDPSDDLVMPSTYQGERRSLTDVERIHLFKAAENHASGLMFETHYYSGIRPGEMRALNIGDLDHEIRALIIDEAMASGSTQIKDPKTKAGKRVIPIPDCLFEKLALIEGGPFDPMFRQIKTGKRHTESSYYKAWQSFKKAIDISMGAKMYRNKITMSLIDPEIDPYYLRHTCCTNWRDMGIHITHAAEMMGHEDINITYKIYTHNMDSKQRAAVQKVLSSNAILSLSTDYAGIQNMVSVTTKTIPQLSAV